MSAILGTYNFDLWNGPAPPAVKSVVDLIYRPGQAVAAAKILPSQSTESGFEGVAFAPVPIEPQRSSYLYRNVPTVTFAVSPKRKMLKSHNVLNAYQFAAAILP